MTLRSSNPEEYDDMCRQVLGEYLREKVPIRVLAKRYGKCNSTIHRWMQDARWAIRQEQK